MKKTKKQTNAAILTVLFCLFLTGFLAAFCVTPKISYSEKEKKVLATMPKFTWSSLSDGSFFAGIDTYLSDQFPLREMWIGAAAYGQLITGRNGANGIYQGKDGYLIPVPFERKESQLQKNCLILRKFCAGAQANCYLMPVPSTGYVMDGKLPATHADYRDDWVYDTASAMLDGYVSLVDLRQPLRDAAKQEQIFYRTDHHWTSAGAFTAYRSFLAAALPAATTEKEAYNIETIPGFYGTSYAKSGLWMNRPDAIELWRHKTLQRLTVETIDDDIGTIQTGDSLFDLQYADQGDKYPVFLGGNHSYVKISNPDAATKEKILLVKDSFANSFAPFLAEQYSEVYLVDLRYSRQRSVSELIAGQGVGTVLFLYSTEDLAGDNNFLWLK